MASVKVAVRVRPFNQRERDMDAKLIIQMEGKKTRIINSKAPGMRENDQALRNTCKEFTFDHSYWSYDPNDPHFVDQEQVYEDLGTEVITSAFEGYNACVFAYGQTGSGKTFTMMGSGENQGLIPRICKTLFARMRAGSAAGTSYRTEVSYLEIYNERVKDLLRANASHSLRVREHPKRGPYVQDLSRHLVSDYADIQECMVRGNTHRTTASTNMNDVSSRSHAIFTIMFVQAGFSNDMPSETVSKVHLVDLAGSERADATGATGQRLKEGAHINKSLVTLGSVISALAEFSSQQAVDSSHRSSRSVFIPYRDSVLTWLLKDSLGGNSKTIMIAAISPADCNYGETLSTLRYANRAKNIINKPTINEDPNVKLIRELRDEISKLKALMFNQSQPNAANIEPASSVLAQLEKKQAQEKVLTEEWAEKWRETQLILREQRALGLRKSGLGVVLDSDMPHLVGIDDDLLSTGVTLYHLKEGETLIGTEDASTPQDIVLNGAGVESEHCSVVLEKGIATLIPKQQAQCWVNTVLIDKPTRLSQGCIILLGRTNMFRYNDPIEAAKLRKEGSRSHLNLSRLSLLSWSTTDLAASMENLNGTLEESGNEVEIEQQRMKLQRERELFTQQQAERESDWLAEQQRLSEQLATAQKRLEIERQQMEADYQSQCRKLAEDWRKLEEKQQENVLTFRKKELELKQKRDMLEWERNEVLARVDVECKQITALEASLNKKQRSFSELLATTMQNMKLEHKINDVENFLAKTQDTPISETDSDYLISLLHVADSESIEAIRDLVNVHKKELASLELELQSRIESLSNHHEKVMKLDSEIAELRDSNPSPDGGPDGDPGALQTQKQALASRTREQMQKIIERKRSLTLNLKRAAPQSSDSSDFNFSSSTSQDDTSSKHSSPLKTSDTFHTATSACSIPSNTNINSNAVSSDNHNPDTKLCVYNNFIDNANKDDISHNNVNNNTSEGVMPQLSDSDELSSTDDCRPVSEDCNSAQSSSSFEKISPLDSLRLRRRTNLTGRKYNSDEPAVKAMKRLCQRVARQRMMIMRNLETDCSKDELNEQIAVLQELQKQYIKLEMALQNPTEQREIKNISSDYEKGALSPVQTHPLSDNEFYSSSPINDSQFSKNENIVSCSPISSNKASATINTSKNENESLQNCSYVINNEMRSNSLTESSIKRNSLISSDLRRNSVDYSSKTGKRPTTLRCSSTNNDFINAGSGRVLNSVYLTSQNVNDTSPYSLSLTRSLPSFAAYENDGYIISVPTYVLRGAGTTTHYEYEIRIHVQDERWSILRRYKRFRELHLNMRAKYGAKVETIPFPPRQFFSTTNESVARQRRGQLETYLRRLLTICSTLRNCPLYISEGITSSTSSDCQTLSHKITKIALLEFSVFFQKGTFETDKYGTS